MFMSFRLQHPPYFTVPSIPIHVRGRQYSCESGTQNLFSKVFLQCSVGIWQLPSTSAETLSTTKQKAEQPISLFFPQVYPSLSCGECSRLTAGKSWVQKRTGNDVLPAICWSCWPACSLYPEPALFAKGSDQHLSVSLSGEICSYTVRVNWEIVLPKKGKGAGKGSGPQIYWGAADGAGWLFWRKGGSWGNMITLYNCLKGSCNQDISLFSQVKCVRTRENGLKLHCGRFICVSYKLWLTSTQKRCIYNWILYMFAHSLQ